MCFVCVRVCAMVDWLRRFDEKLLPRNAADWWWDHWKTSISPIMSIYSATVPAAHIEGQREFNAREERFNECVRTKWRAQNEYERARKGSALYRNLIIKT